MSAPRRGTCQHFTLDLDLDRGQCDSVVSVAGLVRRPVRNPAGEVVGHVSDVVARWDTGEPHPPLAGLVVRVGSRRAFIPATRLAEVRGDRVALTTSRLTLREFGQREGEVCLVRDILDRQLLDVVGVRVVRAADLYLAGLCGRICLVGVDVGLGTLLRRLGPARWRAKASPDVVIDWASVHSFGSVAVTESSGRGAIRLDRPRREVNRLQPGALAALLEDLGHQERRELLDPDTAGGVMTTTVVVASVADTVEHVRVLLRAQRRVANLDAVVVVDERGHLVDDVPLVELLLAQTTTPLAELIGPPYAVWVTPDTPVRVVAARMLDAHRLSAVVVDDQLRPIGRILADDVLLALLPSLGTLRLPRPRLPT